MLFFLCYDVCKIYGLCCILFYCIINEEVGDEGSYFWIGVIVPRPIIPNQLSVFVTMIIKPKVFIHHHISTKYHFQY